MDHNDLTHSVWNIQTPFIGTICNCNRDCMAYRIQYQKELAQVMWRRNMWQLSTRNAARPVGSTRGSAFLPGLIMSERLASAV
ncbi:MAG: hypothetical protein HGA96_09520 [Desulfobulbaceae bacterium]|nr:hypothetical protein [Desulfobulbaceae bacterium]